MGAELNGRVDWGGPAVANDGTVYLGTSNGHFYPVDRNGTLRCTVTFRDGVFDSTPAVLPRGDVAFLVHRQMAGDTIATELALISPDCQVLWTERLPAGTAGGVGGFGGGSVKVWSNIAATFLFVHGYLTNDHPDVTDDEYSPHELLVYTDTGDLFARHQVGGICLEGGGSDWPSPWDIWDFIAGIGEPGTVPPLYQQLGLPGSTPAILDAPIDGFSSPETPLVAVTNWGPCQPQLKVLQFFPTLPFDDRLQARWTRNEDGKADHFASPAVLPEGKVVVGSTSKWLRVYDLQSRSVDCDVQLEGPITHPPAMGDGRWFVGVEYHVNIVEPDCDLADTRRPQPYPIGGTLSAPAIGLSQAFVPNFTGFEMFSYDLRAITHALQSTRFRTANPAVTAEGRVYVIGEEFGEGKLFAFGRP